MLVEVLASEESGEILPWLLGRHLIGNLGRLTFSGYPSPSVGVAVITVRLANFLIDCVVLCRYLGYTLNTCRQQADDRLVHKE